MRTITHMLAWYILFTFSGWMIGASLYWRFAAPHLTVTQLLAYYWQDYLFFLGGILGSWIVIKLTEQKNKRS